MKKISALLLWLVAFSVVAQPTNEYLQPLKYRLIGPFRGGRSVASSGVIGDPLTYYMSTTGGGLWKTSDAGQRWTNVSDNYFETGSVGAVAVSESHPYIIYVGMGEHAPRGVMTSYGDGVYKSTDAGKTWTKMGLEKTQHISRIRIHPTNPDIVYVAAQGALHGPNKERGVYKSVDGGTTWNQILFINDLTGCSELDMDMNYPDILYAGMWQHQRTPWKVISGGPGSGLHKSIDGGKTWKKIENGLPEEKGKMAVAVSRANSQKVYALVEGNSEKDEGGLFVSGNGGDSWRLASGDNRLTQRAWYYTEVFADPQDEHTVYVLSAPALRSIDGGQSWERITGTHGDYHDLWINPDNPKNLVISNDGGAAISFDQGAHWSTQSNMPTAQIYRLNADNLWPYHIYGGQQDNTSIKISSLAQFSGGISEKNWEPSAGGESAFLAFDPDNPRFTMGGSYLGSLQVMDHQSGGRMRAEIYPEQYLGRAARDMKYLFNWNSPVIWSQHEPGTFYHGAQYVLKTQDLGKSWKVISPDLTRNLDEKQGKGGGPLTNEAVGAENYGTLSYLMESPHEKGVIWTGSDDGQVYRTADGGASWENVTPKGLGEALVNAIEISPHDPATAYVATTKYKFNDYTPAVYKTTNNGKSWTNISEGIPYGAFTRVVREDAGRKDLLYLGTEKGMYASWNGGTSWESLQLNLPVTPILDLKVHQGDLIVATSGRSIWILDDLNVLQARAPAKGFQFIPPEPTTYGFWYGPLNGSSTNNFSGAGDFTGINPANGLVLYYELPKLEKEGSLEMRITNAQGDLVRSFAGTAPEGFKRYDGGPPAPMVLPRREGLNRFVWDMRTATMPGIPEAYIEASYRGHRVPPGDYTIELIVNGESKKVEATILTNPTLDVSEERFNEFDVLMTEMEAQLTAMHDRVNQMAGISEQLIKLRPRLEGPLVATCDELIAKLIDWDEQMVQRKSKAYDDVENFENKFTAEYLYLINATESQLPRVNDSSYERKKELEAQWASFKATSDTLLSEELPAFNEALWVAGIGAIEFR